MDLRHLLGCIVDVFLGIFIFHGTLARNVPMGSNVKK